jgi:hypothetical protein
MEQRWSICTRRAMSRQCTLWHSHRCLYRCCTGKREFHTEPGFGSICPAIRPPKAAVLRYALNMATEKQPVCDFLGGGRVPARRLVAPVPDYPAPTSLPVEIDGREYDVLSFDALKPLELCWRRKILNWAGQWNGC